MKFGKSLQNEIAETLPEWKGKFISYKKLKKQLKLIAPWQDESKRCRKRSRPSTENCLGTRGGDVNDRGEEIGFMQLLDRDLRRIHKFFVGKEEEYIIKLKEQKDRVENLGCCENTTQLKIDILDFHREMVLLLHYSVLNFTGLLKIVKKHNKKTGTSIHLTSMPSVLQQPFFITDLLCKLLKQCEAMLNQLFLV